MNLFAKMGLTSALALGLFSVASAKTATTATTKTSTYRAPAAVDSSGFKNEITTNLTSGYFYSEKACKDCSTASVLDVSGSYLRHLQDNIQVGGEARLRNLSKEVSGTGSSENLIDLAAIAAYNFQPDMKNSFYGKGGIGFYSVRKNALDGYESKLGLFVGAGKRFELLPSVTYTPELRLVKKGDIDIGFELALLNFSIHWD